MLTDLVHRAAVATTGCVLGALLVAAASLAAAPSAPPDGDADARVTAQPADTALARLQAEIAALVAEFHGDAGVAAIHVESGRGVAASGERPFFLASVYKVPIAIAVLRRVDEGTIALSDSVRLEPWDFRLGRATLAPNRPRGAGAYPVARLLESALRASDNTASDALLALAGGPAAVTDTLRALGVDGIRIDRSEGEFLLDYYGLPDSLPVEERTPARLTALLQSAPASGRDAARERFLSDPRDAASALSLAELLERLWRGEMLSPAGTRLLFGYLRNGWIDTRIVAGLPAGTPIWHKTGSWREAATHDAGIVELPDGTHLVLVVLVRQARPNEPAAERLIAEIARTAWSFWAGSADAQRGGASASASASVGMSGGGSSTRRPVTSFPARKSAISD